MNTFDKLTSLCRLPSEKHLKKKYPLILTFALKQNCYATFPNCTLSDFFYSTVHLLFYFMYYLFSDGLIDCQDPDCCYRSECLNHHLCLTMDDPKDILRHNNASKSYVFTRSSGTSSFWERIRFLVMPEKGVQRYAQISHFDPK